MRRSGTILFFALCCLAASHPANGQEYLEFEIENESANATYGWDFFVGAYPEQHASSLDDSGAELSVAPAGGVVSSTGNLYSLFTIPTYTFLLQQLDDSLEFTSVVVQVATTEIIDETRLSQPPTEFIFLGARGSLEFDNDVFPINYYWIEWQGMASTTNFEVELAGAEIHTSFCSARASYFNTASPANITFGDAILLGDVNCDGNLNLLDVGPFVDLISSGSFLDKGDMNQDGQVNLLDVGPFVEALSG